MTLLIIYCIISAIVIGYSVIPDKDLKDIGGFGSQFVFVLFCIAISPIIFTIAVFWSLGTDILDRTVRRKKVHEKTLKMYEEVSNGTQKRLTNCMKRYFDYFGRN